MGRGVMMTKICVRVAMAITLSRVSETRISMSESNAKKSVVYVIMLHLPSCNLSQRFQMSKKPANSSRSFQ